MECNACTYRMGNIAPSEEGESRKDCHYTESMLESGRITSKTITYVPIGRCDAASARIISLIPGWSVRTATIRKRTDSCWILSRPT